MSALLFREPSYFLVNRLFLKKFVCNFHAQICLYLHLVNEAQWIHSVCYKCVIQTVWVNFKWKEQGTLLQPLPSEMWNQVYYLIVRCLFLSEVPEYRSHQKTASWKIIIINRNCSSYSQVFWSHTISSVPSAFIVLYKQEQHNALWIIFILQVWNCIGNMTLHFCVNYSFQCTANRDN